MAGGAMFPDLRGASVFITGGGSGIGAALTEAFLQQGAKVAFVQRSDVTVFCDRMETRHGNRPLFLPCDITDERALRIAMAKAAHAHGPITVLVNNAANDTRHDTLSTTSADWDALIAVNLKSYFLTTQIAVPGMMEAGGGAIVNFSSISYMLGMAEMTAYTTANGAITAMTRGHAREFGRDGIRVNAVAPGWVLTERQMRLWASPEALDDFLTKQCLDRHLAPRDIAGPVLFLASRASEMITGQCLAVDGGVVTTAA
ncbi:SDR family oxidoreductase [Mameliella alba]|nr:SDR family oxidoreductase [Mameliella sediminis]MBY6112894.1 SDR family oxidoreductase [Antarctobacter heliothermus]MBY6143758.1 SDR family oxidoreductase [Mameliella alba]MBV7394176.1 SDR family oxidoreductase [Mameliella sediminis]MBY6162412.1 SDR family oxidoreductase [Mameliella alba]MBY6170886.1 SDR family oxidoreductase [Mameliella alba]